MIEAFEWFGSGSAWLPFVLDISLKSAVILVSALLTTRVLRGSSASLRHHVWTLAFAAVLALPVLAVTLPSWRVSVPAWEAAPVPTPALAPTADAVSPGVHVSSVPNVVEPEAVVASRPVPIAQLPAGGADAAPAASVVGLPFLGIAFALWATGMLLLLTRLGVGVVSAWWTARTAVPVTDVGWTRRVEDVAYELGVRRPVRVLQSPWVGTPMAWGILRPTLLLPPEAASWSSDRRRAVVLHEMAHIRRRDCLVHLVASAARAVHWINPLAWIGAKRLRAERERACDDLVLVSGTRSADYAQLLLDVARARGDRRLAWAAVSMARPSELEGRLLAILDPARDRRGVGRVAALSALALAGLLVIPLAAFQAAPTSVGPSGAADRPAPRADATPVANARPAPVEVLVTNIAEVADLRTVVSVGAVPAVADTLEPRVLEAMLRALRSDSERTRAQAAQTLGRTESPQAIPDLIEALRSDPSPDVRGNAAWALGMIESPDAVDGLIPLLASDSSPEVRAEAAWALGMIEDDRATDALIDAIEDPDESVAKNAMWALGQVLGNR